MTDRHWVYELYGEDDALLYVGYSAQLDKRLAQHRHGKPWWGDVARIATESFASRSEALAVERSRIMQRQPLHNVAHRDREEVVAAKLAREAAGKAREVALDAWEAAFLESSNSCARFFDAHLDREPTEDDFDEWITRDYQAGLIPPKLGRAA